MRQQSKEEEKTLISYFVNCITNVFGSNSWTVVCSLLVVNMWTLALCHTLHWFAAQEKLAQPAGWLNLTNLWWGNETQRVCWCILWGLEFQNHFRDLFQMMWSSWHLTNGIIWDSVRWEKQSIDKGWATESTPKLAHKYISTKRDNLNQKYLSGSDIYR